MLMPPADGSSLDRPTGGLHPALPLLARLAGAHPDLAPRRYGRLSACDGGLLEVSGLSVPIGTQCRIAHGRGDLAAEVIGFRNGRSLMMLLGDPVLLRPGAYVRPEGRPGMVPVGEAFLGRAVDGEGHPIDGGPPLATHAEWPAGGGSMRISRSSPWKRKANHFCVWPRYLPFRAMPTRCAGRS